MQAIRFTAAECFKLCDTILRCQVRPEHQSIKIQVQDVKAKLHIALGEIDRVLSRYNDHTSLNPAIYEEKYEAFEQIGDALSEVDRIVDGSSMELTDSDTSVDEPQSPPLLSGLVAEASADLPTVAQYIAMIEDNLGHIFLLADLAEKEAHLLDESEPRDADSAHEYLSPVINLAGRQEESDAADLKNEVPAKQILDFGHETLTEQALGAIEGFGPLTRSNAPSISSFSGSSMMRVAVAGTGGLARLIAHYINDETSHHVILLSRTAQPQLTAGGYQVSVIDYSDIESLNYSLRGIDTVISTVTGPNQIELIKAAVSVGVRRFAPAEFEGLPQLRPANDPLDRSRTLALRWLEHYAQHIQYTKFVCGILYERFQPGGLQQSGIGLTSGFSGQGDYIMDCRRMAAQVPAYGDDNTNPNVRICITAAQDVGRFVCKAIDLRQWPAELNMCGERVVVKDLVHLVERLRCRKFNPIQWHNPDSLKSELELAAAQQDTSRGTRILAHLATAEGRYDFTEPSLNRAFPNVRPISFEDWFVAKWNAED